MVVDVEQNIHAAGWDQPTRLLILRWDDPVMNFNTVPFPLGDAVGDTLQYMAALLTGSEPDGDDFARTVLQRPGFAGMALISEAWTHRSMTAAELAATGRELPDIPGSVEVRILAAIDIRGRIHQVYRERGQQPIYQGWSHTGGRLLEALLSMTAVICRRMPDGEQYVKLLEGVRLDNPADLTARDARWIR